jgi:hypothetical protein
VDLFGPLHQPFATQLSVAHPHHRDGAASATPHPIGHGWLASHHTLARVSSLCNPPANDQRLPRIGAISSEEPGRYAPWRLRSISLVRWSLRPFSPHTSECVSSLWAQRARFGELGGAHLDPTYTCGAPRLAWVGQSLRVSDRFRPSIPAFPTPRPTHECGSNRQARRLRLASASWQGVGC